MLKMKVDINIGALTKNSFSAFSYAKFITVNLITAKPS